MCNSRRSAENTMSMSETKSTVRKTCGQKKVITLGAIAEFITCPACKEKILTKPKPRYTAKTHKLASILCLMSVFTNNQFSSKNLEIKFFIFISSGYCYLPYALKQCYETVHHCPNCGAFIGSYNAEI